MKKHIATNFALDTGEYFQNFEKGSELFSKLMTECFKKTQMDVVYEDFVRWEKFGLLSIDKKGKKNSQRLYSYVDYVWLKIVEKLRLFGFSYDSIINYKPILFEKISVETYYEKFDEMDDGELNKFPKEDLELLINKRNEYEKGELMDFGFFELLMVNVIFNEDEVSLLFFPNSPELIIPISPGVIRQLEDSEQVKEFTKYFNKSHASISLNEIMKKFIKKSSGFSDKPTYSFDTILSKEEHALLKQIRKRHKELKTITIRFLNNEMSLLEIQTTKKIDIESKLIEHINKGDYSNIQVKTVDGKIVDYTNTRKIKL